MNEQRPEPAALDAMHQERRSFAPSPEFAAAALATAELYDDARDPVEWWDRQARTLEWAEPWHTTLEWELPVRAVVRRRASSTPR